MPVLVGSISGYMTGIAIRGAGVGVPLFIAQRGASSDVQWEDVPLALVLGLACGLVARALVRMVQNAKRLSVQYSLLLRLPAAALLLFAVGLAAPVLAGDGGGSAVLGGGGLAIEWAQDQRRTARELVAVLMLRTVALAATLGGGRIRAIFCAGIALTAAATTSAPGLGSDLCHICTGTGLTDAISALTPGSPLPHLHQDWPLPHLRRHWARPTIAGSPLPHLSRDWAGGGVGGVFVPLIAAGAILGRIAAVLLGRPTSDLALVVAGAGAFLLSARRRALHARCILSLRAACCRSAPRRGVSHAACGFGLDRRDRRRVSAGISCSTGHFGGRGGRNRDGLGVGERGAAVSPLARARMTRSSLEGTLWTGEL